MTRGFSKHLIRTVLFALSMAAGSAFAGAVISTELLTPVDQIRTNRLAKFRVKVDSNDTTPVESIRLRVVYDTTSVAQIFTPNEASVEELGDVGADAATLIAGTQYYREVFTDPTNLARPITNMTPRCFNLEIQFATTAMFPNFSISLQDGSGIPVKDTSGGAIPHTFNVAATSNLDASRIISTDWVSQTPLNPGSAFQVKAYTQSALTTNTASLMPFRARARVHFDSRVVAWNTPPAAGDLGTAITAGPVDQAGAGTMRYRDVYTGGVGFTHLSPFVKSSSGTARTLTFSATHTLANGTWIRVELNPPDPAFDGVYQVTSGNGTVKLTYTGTSSLTQSNTETTGFVMQMIVPASKASAGNVRTITTTINHGLAAGNTVMIATNPADPNFDGFVTLASAATNVLTYNKLDSVTLSAFTPTLKARTANVATLTIAGHSFQVGDAVMVDLIPADANFDGARTVSAITASTISFASTGANIASVSTAGTVVRTFSPTFKSRAANVATLTIPGHYLKMGDPVIVALIAADSEFDGARTLTAVTADTVSFASEGADIASASTGGIVQLNFAPTALSRAANVATLTMPGHSYQVGDTVNVALTPPVIYSPSLRSRVTNIATLTIPGGHSFTANDTAMVALSGIPILSTTLKSRTANVATLTITGHPLQVGDSVRVFLSPADTNFDGLRAVTAVTADTISFASTGSDIPAAYTSGSALRTFAVTFKARTANVATLTVTGHNFAVGNSVTVILDTADVLYDGGRIITAVTANTISFPTTAGADIGNAAATGIVNLFALPTTRVRASNVATLTIPGHAFTANDSVKFSMAFPVSPTWKSLTSNVATLTIPGHAFAATNLVNIALDPPDAAFDGPRYIASVVGPTITFTSVGTNVTGAATSGSVLFSPSLRSRTTNVATLTVSGATAPQPQGGRHGECRPRPRVLARYE